MVKKNLKKIIISVVCLVFIAIVGWFIGKPMLELVREPDDFRAWVQDLGFLGRLAYVGMLVFQIIFALIPGEPFEIVAGYAFGAVEGTILCLIGSAIGSIIVFALVRAFGKRFVELFFSLDKINELKFLKDSKKRDALSFIIYMIPGTPKDLLGYFLGLTKIKFGVFLLIITVGRFPSVITSTVGGDAIGSQDYLFAIIVFAVTLILSISGYFVYQLISKRHSAAKE